MQLNQRSSSFGKKQYPGRFPVKAMDQFQKFPIRMLGTQLLDDAEAHAASTMHRNACGFVDDDQRFILEQNFERNELTPCQLLSNRRISFRHSHRRYTHSITGLEVVVSSHAPAVKPHLTAAQQLVDMAFRHIFKPLDQEIVNTLTAAVLSYDFGDRGTQRKFFA
jgi:hypothetical protein